MTLDAFADAVRAVVRDELAGLGVCTFARVKTIDHDTQSVAVSLKNDPDWIDGSIPLVAPGPPGGDDSPGDIPGVHPGDEVLVVFSADDVAGMTAHRGPTPDAGRDARHANAVALPLGPYNGDDAIPDHEPGERIIAHRNGTMLRMGPRGSDDLRLDHPDGMAVRLNSELPPGDTTDPRESPPGESGYAELTHPSGVGVTVSDHGVAITPGDTDDGAAGGGYGYGGYGEAAYGAGGRQQGVTTHRPHNDPWRVEMTGDPDRPAEGHRHSVAGQPAASHHTASGDGETTSFTVGHSLGVVPATVNVTPRSEDAMADHYVGETTASEVTIEYAGPPPGGTDNLSWDVWVQSPDAVGVSGPPVPMREVFARFCVDAEYEAVVNSDATELQDARSFYHAYLAWLETQMGTTLDPAYDPTNPDAGGDWPYPEPVPTPADRDSFSPNQ